MDSPVTLELDTTKLNSRIEELHDALAGQGADVSTIFEDEARLFMRQVIRLTPPKTKEQGERAIGGDLLKIFTPVNEDMLDDLIIQHGHNNIDAWLTSAGGDKKHIQWDYADNTGEVMADFHKRNRNSRGRTYDLKKNRGDIWYSPFVVSFENFAKFRDKMFARVGRRKAGWAVSLFRLGGKAPRWISRHLSGAKGEYHNTYSLDHPSIVMINRSPGISQDWHFVQGAMRVRYQAIGKRIRLVISGYSKDVAQGIKIQRRARPSSDSLQEAA